MGNKKGKGIAKPSLKNTVPKGLQQIQLAMLDWALSPHHHIPLPALKKQDGYMLCDDNAEKVIRIARSIYNRESQYTYGHDYTKTETDCGRYIEEIEQALGDQDFPYYVPNIDKYAKAYGIVSENIKDARPGDYIIFSANAAAKNGKDLSTEYAHIAVVTDVDTANNNIDLLNATSNQDKDTKIYKPGTLQPGHLSLLTGIRTDQGWAEHNGTFKEVVRIPQHLIPDQIGNGDDGVSPVFSEALVEAKNIPIPMIATPAVPKRNRAPYYSSKASKVNSVHTPDSLHSTNSPGKPKGDTVSFNIQSSSTVSHYSTAPQKNMHNEIVEALISAVADAKIGTDIH